MVEAHFLGGAIFSAALTSTSKSSSFDPEKATLSSLAQINIAIDVLTVEISRPLKPSWTVWTSSNAKHIT